MDPIRWSSDATWKLVYFVEKHKDVLVTGTHTQRVTEAFKRQKWEELVKL